MEKTDKVDPKKASEAPKTPAEDSDDDFEVSNVGKATEALNNMSLNDKDSKKEEKNLGE